MMDRRPSTASTDSVAKETVRRKGAGEIIRLMIATVIGGYMLLRSQHPLSKADMTSSIDRLNVETEDGKDREVVVHPVTMITVEHVDVKDIIIGIGRHVMSIEMTAVIETTLTGTLIYTDTDKSKHWTSEFLQRHWGVPCYLSEATKTSESCLHALLMQY